MEEQLILEVSQVSAHIREMMEADALLTGLCIRGELSNYKKYPSGHHYFTLKDGNSALKCVMFRNHAVRLRFQPENGMTVLAAGRITVYPRDGVYQLYCVSMRPEGVGDLAVAFEQLKRKLSLEGLFDESHKKTIPRFPHRIALITSEAGAALHDMLRILGRRYPLAEVKLLPVRVQGSGAPDEIAAAIDYANRYRVAELIITGRGGGSIEDLWAFNEEIVARAIYRSDIPVISAVGHEPDVTIADYTADLRAPTPSGGAELAVPDQAELKIQLSSYQTRLIQDLTKMLALSRQKLKQRQEASVLRSPLQYLDSRRLHLDRSAEQLCKIMRGTLEAARTELKTRVGNFPHTWTMAEERRRSRLSAAAARLDAMSPLKVLFRGYSIAENARGKAVTAAGQLRVGERITLRFAQGRAAVIVDDIQED